MTELVDHLDDTQIKIRIIVVASMLVIYFILFLVSRRADIILRQKNEDRINNEAKIRFHTYHDQITKLPNRASFLESLQESLDRAKQMQRMVGVMMLDVDRFKLINDGMGHETGDSVLRIVARRLQEVIRESDQLFRMGGDEFSIIPEQLTSPERLATLAERILQVVKMPIDIDGHQIVITVSVGISIYPKDDIDLHKLVKNADAAMYLSKQQGRNQYTFYTSELNAEAANRLSYETALQQALVNDEFVLHYQPRVDKTSAGIVGVEALLRWQRADGTMVPPVKFISILEDRDLIVDVGSWVLRTATKQVRAWIDAGYDPVRVSVNVSSRQFHRDNFIEIVESAISEAQIDPQFLELELTESLLLDNTMDAVGVMNELKKLGVILSIDDFGTGYSSLSYLKLLPIDYLKIDRSFIKDLMLNEKDVAIVNTITTLANELHIGVVAEGVEEQGHWDFMQSRYCQELQGFFFSRPVEAEKISEILRKQGVNTGAGVVLEQV